METKSKIDQIFIYCLAGFVILCAFIFVLTLCFHVVPDKNAQMVNIFGGSIVTAALTIIGFYFGSSKSSADKTAIIANSTPILQPVITSAPDWVMGDYISGQLVTFGGEKYKCINSTNTKQPPTDTAYWQKQS